MNKKCYDCINFSVTDGCLKNLHGGRNCPEYTNYNSPKENKFYSGTEDDNPSVQAEGVSKEENVCEENEYGESPECEKCNLFSENGCILNLNNDDGHCDNFKALSEGDPDKIIIEKEVKPIHNELRAAKVYKPEFVNQSEKEEKTEDTEEPVKNPIDISIYDNEKCRNCNLYSETTGCIAEEENIENCKFYKPLNSENGNYDEDEIEEIKTLNEEELPDCKKCVFYDETTGCDYDFDEEDCEYCDNYKNRYKTDDINLF